MTFLYYFTAPQQKEDSFSVAKAKTQLPKVFPLAGPVFYIFLIVLSNIFSMSLDISSQEATINTVLAPLPSTTTPTTIVMNDSDTMVT